MSDSLENVLSGNTEVIEAPEVVAEIAEVEPTVETTEPLAEVAEPVEVAPTATEDTAEDFKGQIKAFQAKADDEKHKRQALQQQIEAFSRQQQETQELPDAYAEPDKAINFAVSQVEQRFQNKLLNMSELGAKTRYTEDFDTMKDHFFEVMATQNPALQAEALTQVDPYEFIYRSAKNNMELSKLNEAGGVEGYRASLEAEIRASMEIEYAAKSKTEMDAKIESIIPGSLSTQRAAGGNVGKTYTGDQPLSKIVGS